MADELDYLSELLSIEVAAIESRISHHRIRKLLNNGDLAYTEVSTQDGRVIRMVARGDVFELAGRLNAAKRAEQKAKEPQVPRAPKGFPALHRPSYDYVLDIAVDQSTEHWMSDPSLDEEECIVRAANNTFTQAQELGFSSPKPDWTNMVRSAYTKT